MSEQAGGLEDVLAMHAGVNSTAGWQGSPDPSNPRNIRRVCKCGEVIGWHDRRSRPGVSFPLSGYAFDEPHRAHLADAMRAWLLGQREVVAEVLSQNIGGDYPGRGEYWLPEADAVLGALTEGAGDGARRDTAGRQGDAGGEVGAEVAGDVWPAQIDSVSAVIARHPEAFDERQRPVCGHWSPHFGPCVCGNKDGHPTEAGQ